MPILAEAPGEIKAVFGETGMLKLELEWDPEDGDCWLSVGIPSAVVDERALPLLDAFEDRLWGVRQPSAEGIVIFDVIER